MTRHLACLLALASINTPAALLGVYGNTHAISEPDFIDVLKARAQTFIDSGQYEALKQAALERAKQSIMAPPAVEGLRPASAARSFTFDPSIVLTRPLQDADGQIIVPAGVRLNPLRALPWNKAYILIDGTEPKQLAWAREQIAAQASTKVIFVAGRYLDFARASQHPAYFDQGGVIVKHFGISATPARIEQEGEVLRVNEYAL